MKFVLRLFILLFSLTLVGCSYISTPSFMQMRDRHYLEARSIQPIRIPPGMSSDAFQNYYPVSDRAYPQSNKDISLVPPGLMQK